MRERLNNIKLEAEKKLNEAGSLAELESIRLQYLGKKRRTDRRPQGMGSFRRRKARIGQLANEIRSFIEEMLEEKTKALQEKERNMRLEAIDVTMPGKRFLGKKHRSA